MRMNRRERRDNALIEPQRIEDMFHHLLKRENMLNLLETDTLKEIIGLDFTKKVPIEDLISYLNDGGASNDAIFKHYVDSMRNLRETNRRERFNLKQNIRFRTLAEIVETICIESAVYLTLNSVSSVRDIHDKLFGDDVRAFNKGKGMDFSSGKSIVRNYVEAGASFNLFVPNSLINTPKLSSLILHIFNISNSHKAVEGLPLSEYVDLTKLRKLLTLISPDSFSKAHNFLKDKKNVEKVIEKGFLETMPRSIIGNLNSEYPCENTFRLYAYLFSLTVLLQCKEDKIVEIFKSEKVIYDLESCINTSAKFDGSLEALVQLVEERGREFIRTVNNSVIQAAVQEGEGLVSIDKIIGGYYMRTLDEATAIEVEFDTNLLTKEMSNAQLEIVTTFKNRKESIKKLRNDEPVSEDMADLFIELLSAKLLTHCQFIRISREDSEHSKTVKLRDAIDAVNIMLPTANSISLNDLQINSLEMTTLHGLPLISFVKDNEITDEFIFLLLNMLHTVMSEYKSINSDVLNRDTFGKLEELSTIAKDNIKLENELAIVKAENLSMRKKVESSDDTVRKEVDRLTKALHIDNTRLEKRLLEEEERSNNLEQSLTDTSRELEELAKAFDELLAENERNDKEDLSYMIDYLKTKKISLLGGYPPLIQRVQQLLPNIVSIYKEGPSVNFRSLDNYELNIIYTPNMSHGFTYALKANTSYGDNFLKVDKRISAKEIIRRAYKHLIAQESNDGAVTN